MSADKPRATAKQLKLMAGQVEEAFYDARGKPRAYFRRPVLKDGSLGPRQTWMRIEGGSDPLFEKQGD